MIYWTVAGDWILSGQRTGFFHSLFLNHTPTHVVWEDIDEDTSVVQAREHMARNLVRNVNEISAKRTTSLTEERSKKSAVLEGRGKFTILIRKTTSNETLTIARKSWKCRCTLQCRADCERSQGNLNRNERWQGEVSFFPITTTRKCKTVYG